MEAERQDHIPTNGGDSESAPANSMWSLLLAFLAGCLCLVLLTGVLYLIFDLPKDSLAGVGAICTLVSVTNVAKPRSYRESAIVAVVGGAAGAFALLCYLPVAAFVEGLELSSVGFLARGLGLSLCVIFWAVCALMACQRLIVPTARQPR